MSRVRPWRAGAWQPDGEQRGGRVRGRGRRGRSGRERTRPRASLTRADRVLITLVTVTAIGIAAAGSLQDRGRTEPDPEAQTRQAAAQVLSGQAGPVLAALRRQAVAVAQRTTTQLPTDPALPRLIWRTDGAGRVTATSPAAAALLARTRPVRAARSGSVAAPTSDPLIGGDVVVASAALPAGGVVSVAVPGGLAGGLSAPPVSSATTTAALIAPDGTTADAAGRRAPASPDLVAAARAAARRASVGIVRFTGQAGVPRSAVVRPLGDGWVAVAEGPQPASDTTRRTALLLLFWAGAAATLLALLLAVRVLRRNSRHAEAVQSAVLTVAGHELRTPLTSILGTAQTLTRSWTRLDDDQRSKLVSTLSRQARVLDRMVERLLHAGRLASGEALEIEPQPTPVDRLVTGLFDDLRTAAPLHDFKLEVEPGAPPAMADPRALTQVLGHLLDNAVKFSPDGGPVHVSLRSDGRRHQRLRIEVADEGVGLPADTSRLFRPFGQSEPVDTRTAEEGGVGVGLAIVKSLVDAMGGSVAAERHSRGSRFVVTLPGAATTQSD